MVCSGGFWEGDEDEEGEGSEESFEGSFGEYSWMGEEGDIDLRLDNLCGLTSLSLRCISTYDMLHICQ